MPALPSLTAEVSNPASAELFVGGVSKGAFTAAADAAQHRRLTSRQFASATGERRPARLS